MTSLRIKELCKEKGIRQKDIAPIIGVSETSLSTAINEGRFSVATLEKIAAFLGVGVPELFAETGGATIKCPKCGQEIPVTISLNADIK